MSRRPSVVDAWRNSHTTCLVRRSRIHALPDHGRGPSGSLRHDAGSQDVYWFLDVDSAPVASIVTSCGEASEKPCSRSSWKDKTRISTRGVWALAEPLPAAVTRISRRTFAA